MCDEKVNRTKDFESLLSDCEEQLSQLEISNRDRAVSQFNSASGCESCRGRGWVITWDTLDSMTGCYHEHKSCPEENCTPESRKISGLHPSNNKYDNFHTNSRWEPSYTNEESETKTTLLSEIARLSSEIREENYLWTPTEGKLVKVVNEGRGRKDRRTPKGTEGLVKKVFTNDWGTTKLIIIDRNGKKWWPGINNVAVIDPNPDTARWLLMDRKERQVSGYPVVATIVKKARSGRAVFVRTTTAVEMWVPVSQAPEISEAKAGQTLSIMLPMWLAENKGLVTSG